MPASGDRQGVSAQIVRYVLAGHRLETEHWSLILSLPVAAAFLPGYSSDVAAGFDALGHAPEWYKLAVGSAIAFAFGRTAARGVRTLLHKPPAQGST